MINTATLNIACDIIVIICVVDITRLFCRFRDRAERAEAALARVEAEIERTSAEVLA